VRCSPADPRRGQPRGLTRLRDDAGGLADELRATFRAAPQALRARNAAFAPLVDPLLELK